MASADNWFRCPDGFRVISPWGGGYALEEKLGGLRVIVDCAVKADGNKWLHISYSRARSTPTHEDTCKIKALFIGNRYAYAVFPPSSRYVNIHSHCLHLWARWDEETDGQVLPEFSEILDGIGPSI